MQPITFKPHIKYLCSQESQLFKPIGFKQTTSQAIKYQCSQIKSPKGLKMQLRITQVKNDFYEQFQGNSIQYILNNPQFNKPDTLCRFNNPLLLYRECVKFQQNCAHEIFTITKNFYKRNFNIESLEKLNVQQVAKNAHTTKLSNLFKYLKMNNSVSELYIELPTRQYMDASQVDLSKIFRKIYKCQKLNLNFPESLLNQWDLKKLGLVFSKLPYLEYLDLDFICNVISVEQIKYLTKGLSNCKKIKTLKINLNESSLDDEAIAEINRFIGEEVPLLENYKYRSFWKCCSSEALESLGPALAQNNNLKQLQLFNVCRTMNFKLVKAILEGLVECPNFTTLKLNPTVTLENNIQFISLGIAIGKLTNLRELSFSFGHRQSLTAIEERKFFGELASLTNLRNLSLTFQKIKLTNNAFYLLCKAIEGFKCLTKLYLNLNNAEMNYVAFRALGDALRECKFLSEANIGLQNTLLSESNLKEFCDQLKYLEYLDYIYLDLCSTQGLIVKEGDEKKFVQLFPYIKDRIIKSKKDLPDYD